MNGMFQKFIIPENSLLGLYLLIGWLQKRKEELIDESRSGEEEEYLWHLKKKEKIAVA